MINSKYICNQTLVYERQYHKSDANHLISVLKYIFVIVNILLSLHMFDF